MKLNKVGKVSIILSILLCYSAFAKNALTDFGSKTEQERYQTLDELLHSDFLGSENVSTDCSRHESALLNASHDKSYRVRNLVIILLSRCKSSPNAGLIANRLLELIQSPDERSEVRDTILEALGGMGELTPSIKQLLLDYAATSKGAIRRETATFALASFNVVDNDILGAIDTLLNAKRASSRVVALQSYRALNNALLQSSEDAKIILKSLYTKLPNSKVNFNRTAAYLIAELVPLSQDAVPELIELLDESPFSRKSTAYALVEIGRPSKSALPNLKLILEQSTGFEKKTIEQTIKTLEEL